jgi:hypothetical protein
VERKHDGIRDHLLRRLRDVLRSVCAAIKQAAMTPFVVACIHTIVLSVELEVAVYLIKLRNQLMAVVKK